MKSAGLWNFTIILVIMPILITMVGVCGASLSMKGTIWTSTGYGTALDSNLTAYYPWVLEEIKQVIPLRR